MHFKSTFWRILFLILSAAYLIPETIFNAQLVSLIGLGTPEDNALEQLEVYGRAISGLGVTLLIADLLPNKFFKTVFKGVLSITILAVIVWPTVFFGQKVFVESFLIEPSSAQEREYAVLSAAFRDALAINALEVVDLEYDAKARQTSENLTFSALFGGLLYADETLADNLESHKKGIIKQFVQKKAYQDFDQHYQNFSALYNRLSANYSEYAKGSNKYNKTLTDIPSREQDYWRNVEQEVNQGWKKYQQATKTYVARAEGKAQKYGPKIYQYHKETNRCLERYNKSSYKDKKTKCIERLNARYKTEINKSGLGYVEPNYWLIVEDISGLENTANTLLAGVLTGGLSTALQALSLATGGDAGIKDKRYKYTDDPEHYQLKVLQHPNFQAQFEKDTGYPMGMQNLVAFRAHKETQKRLLKSLADKGLTLNNNWHISNRKEFSQSVANKVKNDADKQWQQAMKERGLNLPINLDWNSFQHHPSVQKKIESQMGDMYVSNVKSDWSQANFKRYVLDPNIAKRTQRYLDMIEDARPHFEDGEKYADAGKQALRSVIIPPISMSISLFLICLTLIKLPIKSIEVVKPDWLEGKPKGVSISIKSLPPILLIILPVMLVNNQFTALENSPVNYFLTKVEKNSNPIFSYALRWTLHAQPVLHPMGLAFENKTSIYQSSKPFVHLLSQLDEQLPRWQLSHNQKQNIKDTIVGETRLTILANVESSTIRIMNVGPKYQPGMLLKPGAYDIQVSATGYETYRGWHQILAGEQDLEIILRQHL